MLLSGEAYSRRLEEFSDSTLQLMADICGMSKEKALKMSEITTNSEYSEEEVVRLLTELKNSK
jgi:hypothetical protein